MTSAWISWLRSAEDGVRRAERNASIAKEVLEGMRKEGDHKQPDGSPSAMMQLTFEECSICGRTV